MLIYEMQELALLIMTDNPLLVFLMAGFIVSSWSPGLLARGMVE